jgi:hypothetical protein
MGLFLFGLKSTAFFAAFTGVFLVVGGHATL